MRVLLLLTAPLIWMPNAFGHPRPPVAPPTSPDQKLADHLRQLGAPPEDERLQGVKGIKDLGPAGVASVPALVSAFPDLSPRVQTAVAELLATYGPAAKEALPVLIEVIRQPQASSTLVAATANAIAALGDPRNPDMVRACLAHPNLPRRRVVPVTELMAKYPTMLPVVADYLADPRSGVRNRAAQYVFRFLKQSEAEKRTRLAALTAEDRQRVVARLQSAVEVEQVPVRGWALGALIEMDPSTAEDAMPAVISLVRARENSDPSLSALVRLGPTGARLLIDYLDDPSADVRETLIEVFAGFGDSSTPALAAGLCHRNPRIREGVLLALGRSPGRGSLDRVPVLARLSDPDPMVRLAAAEALVSANSKAVAEAVPVLVEASFDRSPAVRSRALYRLQWLERTARPAVPAMLRRVREGDLETRFAAAQVLAAADRSTWRTYAPVFVEVIRTGSEYERRQAAWQLRDAGPVAIAALPALRGMFDEDDALNRIAAAEAVGRIAPFDAADAIAVLVGCLDTGDPDIRTRNTNSLVAIRALQRIGRPARPALPALLDFMRYRADTRFGAEAALTAIKLDPDKAGPAYDEFRAQLQPTIREPDTRWLDTLSGLGEAAKPLLPELIAALNSKHEAQREAALATLKQLGPAAAEALPALREMAKEKRGGERVNEAIKAIEADR